MTRDEWISELSDFGGKASGDDRLALTGDEANELTELLKEKEPADANQD